MTHAFEIPSRRRRSPFTWLLDIGCWLFPMYIGIDPLLPSEVRP